MNPVAVMPELSTPRLRLRPLSVDDAPFALQLVNEPGWLRFIGDKNVHSVEDARRYLEKGPIQMYANEGVATFLVTLHDGTALGLCGLVKRASLAHKDLGFAFLDAHSRRGYAYESSVAVLESARRDMGIEDVLAITLPDNLASCALLIKLGFVYQSPIASSTGGADLSLYLSRPAAKN